MAKFYGAIGFGITKESAPGVWDDNIVEKTYAGDIRQNSFRYAPGEKINSDLTLNQTISIISDNYILENSHNIRYVVIRKVRWEVTSIDFDHPRTILMLGGVYNG